MAYSLTPGMNMKGKMCKIQLEEFEWRICDFSTLTLPYVWSPSFSFAGATWSLLLYPEGTRKTKSSGFLGIYLYRLTSGLPIKLEYSLGLKTAKGQKDRDVLSSNVFLTANYNYGKTKVIARSELFERESDYLPSNVLTVFCTLQYPNEGANAEIVTATEKLTVSEKPASAENLCDALKRIMHSGEHSDTTIKVKGEEFKLHKNILGARSPYFDLMFKKEMKENLTGVVTIDDCEPDTFRFYVHFLYTGKVDHTSAENVCDLYAVADKFQDNQYKEECLQFMMNSISTESFCDYIILAITYKVQKLLNSAINMFASNTKEIITSVKWQAFLSEYPFQANELHVKALDHNSAS